MRLQDYFQEPLLSQALQKYAEIAARRDWPITGNNGKAALYEFAELAFRPTVEEAVGLEAFSKLYRSLKRYWKVFRRARGGRYWSAEQIYSTLIQQADIARASPITLLTIGSSVNEQAVVRMRLEQLRELKEMSRYPQMAVSKFLHFYNPHLFPIYDQAEIWNNVLWRCFRNDYEQFCSRRAVPAGDSTGEFNLTYMRFCSEVMASSDIAAVMQTFCDWFAQQGPDAAGAVSRLVRFDKYYAAAFEFVAIGAAAIEND